MEELGDASSASPTAPRLEAIGRLKLFDKVVEVGSVDAAAEGEGADASAGEKAEVDEGDCDPGELDGIAREVTSSDDEGDADGDGGGVCSGEGGGAAMAVASGHVLKTAGLLINLLAFADTC